MNESPVGAVSLCPTGLRVLTAIILLFTVQVFPHKLHNPGETAT